MTIIPGCVSTVLVLSNGSTMVTPKVLRSLGLLQLLRRSLSSFRTRIIRCFTSSNKCRSMFRCYARGRSGDHGENTHTVCRGWRVILILPGLVFYHIRPRDSGAFAGKYVEVGQQPGYFLYRTWVRCAILAKKQDILDRFHLPRRSNTRTSRVHHRSSPN